MIGYAVLFLHLLVQTGIAWGERQRPAFQGTAKRKKRKPPSSSSVGKAAHTFVPRTSDALTNLIESTSLKEISLAMQGQARRQRFRWFKALTVQSLSDELGKLRYVVSHLCNYSVCSFIGVQCLKTLEIHLEWGQVRTKPIQISLNKRSRLLC